VGTQETELYEEALTKEDNLFSTLISKNGKIVFEEYYNGKTKDSLCDIQSLTKGVMSILVGIAIDKKYIENVDEPIKKFFPGEFKNIKDEKKNAITIRHILNQTSGLSWKGYLEHEEWLSSKDPISFVLNKELENEPGEKYNYNSGATHLLSVIISKTTGKTTLEFANQVLFQHLNISKVDWQKRNKGYYDGSGLGLKMKPIHLMKIGQLLANNGNWNGMQIISNRWIKKLFDENEKSKTKWGLRNSTHGFCWYQTYFKGDKINYGMGYGGQLIILIPNKELIIVTTCNHDTPNGIDQQIRFLNVKLPSLINKYGS
jgi:CubicO group peptidase (beta-lactamase class C family)